MLLIPMDMPKNCLDCPLQGGAADCRLTGKTYNWGLTTRPSDCPLVEVPKYGRLIDAAELQREAFDMLFRGHADDRDVAFLNFVLQKVPTVIPADKEGAQ